MMTTKDIWLPNAIRKSWPHNGADYWDGSEDVRANPLLILHTTEGGQSCPGYNNSLGEAGGYAPNCTIVVKTREFYQHIPLNRAGRALPYYNASGVQVEICGSCSISWAKQANLVYVGDYTADDLAFINKCLDEIRKAMGILPVGQHPFASYEDLASGKVSVRLTAEQLAATSGIVGHQHIPLGGHIDPGILGTTIVAAAVAEAATPAPAPQPVPAPKPVQAYVPEPTVQLGSTGKTVVLLQTDLNTWCQRHGWKLRLATDGIFGPLTGDVVRAFQGGAALVQDGIVGPHTWAALERAVA